MNLNKKRIIISASTFVLSLVLIISVRYVQDLKKAQEAAKEETIEAHKEQDKLSKAKDKELEEKQAALTKLEETETTLDKTEGELEKAKEELEAARRKINASANRSQVSRSATPTGSNSSSSNTSSSGYRTFTATAYCKCSTCCGVWSNSPTASGTTPQQGRTIAVDPNVIPMGSRVEIKGMGVYIAEDTGNAVNGNIVDVYHQNHSDAMRFGRQQIQLRVLD